MSGFASIRQPLARRNRQSRRDARARVQAHTRHPLTAEQRAREAPRHRSAGARALAALGAVVGSAAAHAAIVAIGIVTAALAVDSGPSELDRVTIQVQEHEKPAEPKPPPPPEPEPAPEATRPKAPEPDVTDIPKPLEPEPQQIAENQPLRVVGLSLDSTSEAGDGPAFAVGNTRMGQTAERADDPEQVKKEPAPVSASTAPTAKPAATGNRAASRIPTAKVKYTLPKQIRKQEPLYPATLKAQGIEGDVTVLVTIDESGKVTSVQIIKPSPYPEFNESARATAMAQRYEPATRDGVPVSNPLTYTYRFRLQ